MSISSEITRLQNAKASIKTSIENKGVTVGDGTLDTYASKIDAIETGITPTGTINITENGTYDVSDKASANVNVPSAGISEYFTETISYGTSYSGLQNAVKKFPAINIESNNANNMFLACKNLITIELLDTSNVTTASGMFNNCTKLTTIPKLNTSNLKNAQRMFYSCTSLIEIPQLDLSNLEDANSMFYNCPKLTDVPLLNFSKCTDITNIFFVDSGLINLGGLQNLGQAYSTTQSANYSYYTLNLTFSTLLTHDSLMNVINNLYDIASKGCNTQQLVLGSTNISKLSAEEIAIATNKGFSVS